MILVVANSSHLIFNRLSGLRWAIGQCFEDSFRGMVPGGEEGNTENSLLSLSWNDLIVSASWTEQIGSECRRRLELCGFTVENVCNRALALVNRKREVR